MKYDLFLIILIIILLIYDFTILAGCISLAYTLSNIIDVIITKIKGGRNEKKN